MSHDLGLLTSGVEQLLLSHFYTEDIDAERKRNSNFRMSTPNLLFRGMNLYFNLRRIGVRGQVLSKKPQNSTRTGLLKAKTVTPLALYIMLDAAMTPPLPGKHLTSKDKGTRLQWGNLSSEDLIFRFIGTVGYWAVALVCSRFNHACAAVASLALELSQPEEWPRLNGLISACYTVRGFWGSAGTF